MHESMSIRGLARLVKEMRAAQWAWQPLAGPAPVSVSELEDKVDAAVEEVLGQIDADTSTPIPPTPTPSSLLGYQELLAACRHARGYFTAHAAVEREVNYRPDRAETFEHHARVMDLAMAMAEWSEPLLVTQKEKGDRTP